MGLLHAKMRAPPSTPQQPPTGTSAAATAAAPAPAAHTSGASNVGQDVMGLSWRAQALDHLAASVALANAYEKGAPLLVPYMALHKRRLRWALTAAAAPATATAAGAGHGASGAVQNGSGLVPRGQGQEDEETEGRFALLRLLARYCFSPELAARLRTLQSPRPDAAAAAAAVDGMHATRDPGSAKEVKASDAAASLLGQDLTAALAEPSIADTTADAAMNVPPPGDPSASVKQEQDTDPAGMPDPIEYSVLARDMPVCMAALADAPASIDELHALLVADARSALEWCASCYKAPHKATHLFHPAK